MPIGNTVSRSNKENQTLYSNKHMSYTNAIDAYKSSSKFVIATDYNKLIEHLVG